MGSSCQKLDNSFGLSNKIRDGKLKKNDLRYIRLLKKNRISRIWLVQTKKQKTLHALKITKKVDISKLQCAKLPINEQVILSSLSSPFITNLVSSFQDFEHLYILLQFMPYGNLRDYLNYEGPLSQEETKFLATCILNGLDYLQKKEVVHLDIKPENIVIDSQCYFRLCDFNLSQTLKSKKLISSGVGTFGYQSPEMRGSNEKIEYSADYYSLGIVLYEALTGMNPRKTTVSVEKVRQHLNQFNNISNDCIQFVCGLLSVDQKTRLGSKTIYEIWQHPWIALDFYDKKSFQKKQKQSPLDKQYMRNYLRNSESKSGNTKDDSQHESDDPKINLLMIKNMKFQKKFQNFSTIQRRLTY